MELFAVDPVSDESCIRSAGFQQEFSAGGGLCDRARAAAMKAGEHGQDTIALAFRRIEMHVVEDRCDDQAKPACDRLSGVAHIPRKLDMHDVWSLCTPATLKPSGEDRARVSETLRFRCSAGGAGGGRLGPCEDLDAMARLRDAPTQPFERHPCAGYRTCSLAGEDRVNVHAAGVATVQRHASRRVPNA